ncbi:FAD-dependent oxidoreductase [Chitinimonas sp. PSY-7]|uniref:FAD-dependent oxidoreductase n=1 Tax=Chitinimonas sp. PSY-7 TaxID=3459088 RepID=UPI00403FD0CF
MNRQERLNQLQDTSCFDIVVLGGGINGACLYDTLCRLGYKVLLLDKGDFASGTSQSSGMMIWGGLLYLRNFDIPSVLQLSYDRDLMISEKAEEITPRMMRYLPTNNIGFAKWWKQLGLWSYWLMGMGRRRIPRSEGIFGESELIKSNLITNSLTYEEAFLDQSDARFVYNWIARQGHQASDQIALNYCSAQGEYSVLDKKWQLNIQDTIAQKVYAVKSAMMVNCTGVWADQVNADFSINSPVRHVLSKGVYLGLPRSAQHQSSLFFDLGEHDDVITHVPWGPISLWGPTETKVEHIADGIQASKEDIDFLLDQYGRRYRKPLDRNDIISVRCGIRPLVVGKQYQGDCYPLDLSRRQEVIQDIHRPWISCYGGKLTGCTRMANRVAKLIKRSVAASGEVRTAIQHPYGEVKHAAFPGLAQPVVSAAWCAKNELCCTLEDYLRRRTNIAQWVHRGGLGIGDANAEVLRNISLDLAHGDAVLAAQLFENYRANIKNNFDSLIFSK